MRLFFERALAQKLLHICFAYERALRLIMKFGFLAFFSGFHAPNRNLRSRDFVPPAIEPAREGVLVNRRCGAEVFQFFFPTMRMTLFRFGHTQKNAFALFVALALGQIAIGLRGLDFCLPVAPGDFDRLPSILWGRRLTFAIHNVQSAGSRAALIGGSTFAFSCCAVITS